MQFLLLLFSVDRIQKESDEFMIESQQLEKEYEATIDQYEKKIKELTLANNRAQNEIDSLRVSHLLIVSIHFIRMIFFF